MAYTPGPWKTRQLRTDDSWLVFDEHERQTVAHIDQRWEQQEEAPNAKLIAAAPKLLEACKALVDFAIWMSGSSSFSPGGEAHEGWLNLHGALDQGKAAIATAQGEQ